MQDEISARYNEWGLPPEQAEGLAALVASPPPGLIEPQEWEGASEQQLALLGCIVAASQTMTFGEGLRQLLAHLAGQLEQLSAYDLGRFYHIKGHTAWQLDHSLYTALHSFNRSINLLSCVEGPKARMYRGRVHNSYGQLLQQKGQLFDALKEYEEALQILEEGGQEAALAHVLGSLGRLCLDFGAYAAAERYLLRDLDIVRRTSPGMTRLQSQLLSHLGHCAIELGAYDVAEERYHDSLALAQGSEDHVGEAFALVGCARILVQRGELDEALDKASQIDSLFTSDQIPTRISRILRGLYLRLCADIRQAQGDISAAIESFDAARDMFGGADFVSPVEYADLLRSYAGAVFHNGDAQGAARLLREALTFLDSTAADRFRERMEEELQARCHDSWLLHSAGRFVGQQHIEFLLKQTGLGGFRGEKKSVVVMFSDIRGFSAISQQMSAQKLIGFLNDFLTQMTRCVEICGGFVDKFIGDAVMAVFSLPAPQDDDADRGLQAALLMQAELERFCRRIAGQLPQLAIGTGLHLGEVVAGLIGSPQKRSYTVIGDAVNTSSRLEGMTKLLGAPILISRALYDKLSNPEKYLIRPIGHFIPKGQSKAVEVFDVLGEDDGTAFSASIRREIDETSAALAAFAERDFATAIQAFDALADAAGDEPRVVSYERLRRQAAIHHEQGVPDEWDGAIPLDAK